MKRGRKNVKCCRNPKRKQILKNVDVIMQQCQTKKHTKLLKAIKEYQETNKESYLAAKKEYREANKDESQLP